MRFPFENLSNVYKFVKHNALKIYLNVDDRGPGSSYRSNSPAVVQRLQQQLQGLFENLLLTRGTETGRLMIN
ncbi:hypothetical protein [Pedobacter sp. MC2016-24]|uniref:hypothetical protein n=1 Tax=Pedobacter sp. MC2016-24 TaxID=2780090 RepID=UPI00188101CA|nr:hypothetical protein [Pedobacter sp. MC2016-24]MBE9601478.1 hypothetical protein [Pedobacter sp. MC2016-24]